jgi:hypothetical protein
MDEWKLLCGVWRKMISEEFSSDGVVSAVPIFLFGVTLLATAVGEADAYLYFGTSAAGRLFKTLWTVLGDPLILRFERPVYCTPGLYLDADTNVKAVQFEYIIDSD